MSFVTLRSFLERMNMTLAEYEWMRNQLDEPIKLKKKRRMLDRVQEDSFDPYKEISNNRRHFQKKQRDPVLFGFESSHGRKNRSI